MYNSEWREEQIPKEEGLSINYISVSPSRGVMCSQKEPSTLSYSDRHWLKVLIDHVIQLEHAVAR